MSKQSEAKDRQGYIAKSIPSTCQYCKRYASDLIEQKWVYGQPWYVEKNKRCMTGGFAVAKSGTCKLFERK